jgi:hypothetical protein
MVARGDLPPGEPAFVGGEDGRDKATARPDDLGVALDGIGTAEQIKDGIDAVGVSAVQRVDDVNGLAVVDLLGAQPASLPVVVADGRDDVRAMPKTRSPTRRLSPPAGTRSATPAKSMPTTNGYRESAVRRPRRWLSSGLTPAKRTRISAPH